MIPRGWTPRAPAVKIGAEAPWIAVNSSEP